MSDAISILGGRVTIHHADVMEALRAMPNDSVDSVATDPPYHLTSIVKRFGADNSAPAKEGQTGAFARASAGFMGKEWDGGDIAFRPEVWIECLRVLKPGGYLLAFASTRGFGRMSVAIEDAGFITHPLIAWVFGSGFPKATRIKADGYDGFRYGGQALKPAIEPIYMGQKPFSEPSGTANILKHGTGALNIDGCRVPTGESLDGGAYAATGNRKISPSLAQGSGMNQSGKTVGAEFVQPDGRWPANLIHDGSDEVVSAFPEAPGQQRAVDETFAPKQATAVYGDYGARPEVQPRNDSGSAARFFYSSKADADDRIGSKHPTVKPVNLMRYLVRLVTPPGGTVLDPFAGTGTTGEAAFYEGFNAVLVEREDEYVADIKARMELCLAGPDQRKFEIAKRRGDAGEDLPLFTNNGAAA